MVSLPDTRTVQFNYKETKLKTRVIYKCAKCGVKASFGKELPPELLACARYYNDVACGGELMLFQWEEITKDGFIVTPADRDAISKVLINVDFSGDKQNA